MESNKVRIRRNTIIIPKKTIVVVFKHLRPFFFGPIKLSLSDSEHGLTSNSAEIINYRGIILNEQSIFPV